ncbi:hypothetical protein D7X33_20650 [Butyricicoccus sp. 1XD8-22]|nr:hypothetical protein D7X33_20650 [Butyricicoccus sp. 1XD8-22]
MARAVPVFCGILEADSRLKRIPAGRRERGLRLGDGYEKSSRAHGDLLAHIGFSRRAMSLFPYGVSSGYALMPAVWTVICLGAGRRK